MALRTPPRPVRAAPAARRSSGGGKLIVVLLVVVALGVGYLAYTGKLPGLPRPKPTPTPLLTAGYNPYIDFWNEHSAAVPPELSIGAVTGMADDCHVGRTTRNQPDFLPTDSLLRARAGWVCLVGPPAEVPNSRCASPGTNTWRTARGLREIITIEHGHLVGKRLGGIGTVVDDRGGCMNIMPQTRQQNALMRSRAEIPTADLARANPELPIFYLTVPLYEENSHVPTGVWVFIIAPTGGGLRGPFMNDIEHVTDGDARP